jgi:uncharacterized caspase-like protein
MTTYVSARRATKTSASDCEIRGGEYVKSDRASYSTALKIWLPLAQEGKADAQTYVGEIFEKGLGVPPDFQAAASWYRRAAEQNYSRAAINLGSLYERGLGVPQDPAQALMWYRRAAGLPDLQFKPEAPPPPPPPAAAPAPAPSVAPSRPSPEDIKKAQAREAEVAALRTEVESLKRRLTAKENELEQTRQRLDSQKRSLDRSSGEADQQRAALDRLRRDLDQKRQQEGASATELKALEASVAEREGQVAKKDQEIAQLRTNLAKLESDSKTQQAALDSLTRQSQQTPPSIEILEPQLATARGLRMAKPPESGDNLFVIGRVASASGIAALSVDGRDQTLDGEVFRANVPFGGGEKHVRVVAVDRNGKRTVSEFVIPERRAPAGPPVTASATQSQPGQARVGYAMPTPPIEFGQFNALVIGNNDYAHMPKLQTAVADASEVARILRERYGFRVTLLQNATRYEILSALNKLREQLTDKDNLLIYYGGHGELDQVNQRGNWLPVDAEPNSSANWISNVAITDVLNAMTVRELLVVADSCYSGTLTRSALSNLSGGVTERDSLQLIRDVARQRSRVALTAGGVQPVLDSAGGKHSAFAQAFIDVLGANTGILAGQDMFRILQTRVASAARRANTDQVPEYAPIKFAGHEAGDFFFVRTAAN